ncbi:MAG: PEGA domain-containing protein [Candidatus Poribacteria bacterium]
MKRLFLYNVITTIIVFSSSLGWSQNYLQDETSWALLIEVSDYTDENIPDLVFGDNMLKGLKAALVNVGGYNPEHIETLSDGQNSRAAIQSTLSEFSFKISHSDAFLLYFRGNIKKPPRGNAIFFLPQDVKKDVLKSSIKDSQLNDWLDKIKAMSKIVIIDCYTDDEFIDAYRVNRETLGTAAIFSVQPVASATAPVTFSQMLLQSLTWKTPQDNPDTDENRIVSVGEVYEYIYNNFASIGVLAATDDMNAGIIKLPSMLQVKTEPPGASVFINEKESGTTPIRIIDGLKKGTYRIRVNMPLYLIPEERSVQIHQLRGESGNVSIELTPIKVYGKILDQEGNVIEYTFVSIDGTQYAQRADNDGNYSFEDWQQYGLLEKGKSYTLKAESSKGPHYGEADFIFAGNEHIQRNITLIKRTWFDIAQAHFDTGDYQRAAEAFHLGVDNSTTIPDISPEFAEILLSYFSKLVELQPRKLNYLIATAKLSDTLDRRDESKIYWQRIKEQSTVGSPEYAQAEQRLKELNSMRLPITIVIGVVIILIVFSAWRTIKRYKISSGG